MAILVAYTRPGVTKTSGMSSYVESIGNVPVFLHFLENYTELREINSQKSVV